MTAQATETMLYEGEELRLCNEPLEHFLHNQQPPVKFMSAHTALWRGYIGTWSIEGERLYLKSLKANTHDEVSGGIQEVGLDAVDRKSTRLNSSHSHGSRMPSSA